ncbi:hypothetical protein FDECE_3775 [Fusarium decemcellulare]|nr:hypothetical protein FDECE_3775 [Fusarium decemcellulare]
MAEVYAKCFEGRSEGHALYDKVLGNDMKPGTCGYFNRLQKWVPIIHTLDDDSPKVLDPKAGDDVKGPGARLMDCGEDDEWGLRQSGSVAGVRVEAAAEAAVPGAPGGGATLKFISRRGQGAVLVPGSKVTERRAEPASAFRKWMSDNMKAIIGLPMCDEEVVQDKGLWLITGTFTAKRRALAVLESTGSEISLGLDVTVPGVARAGPAVGFWNSTEHSTGWIVHTDEASGVVLFASGIYYKPKRMSKDLKAVEVQKSQEWLEARVKSSPIDIELGESSRPGNEYVRFWPRTFGNPRGLGELPQWDDESVDEEADQDSKHRSY